VTPYAETRSRQRRVNGVDLFYELTGSGDPLVLVHGSWVDHNSWQFVVPDLARSFRVLTYDRRGHSLSERPLGQGSRREDEEDLAALMEALDLAPAYVVGNSFGGSIALGPGAWEQLPEEVRRRTMNNAPTFLDELQDARWADLDVGALSSFSSPTLLTDGDQSPPWFPKIMTKLAGAIAGAERLTFSGAGHAPHQTHPDEYVRAVVEFIQDR
jgi:pimeloyl-ACP methyl ester carboxylesterase